MSKYVKEMMMDQFRTDLGGAKSILILDFKGLDAVSEHKFRMDLRKKKIKVRTLRNTLARRVFADAGLTGLSAYLTGPSVAIWGGDGPAELAKEVFDRVKKLKKPLIKGGAVDGMVITPAQVEDITKLPSREALIGRIVNLAMSPAQRIVSLANAPASGLLGQLKTLSEGAEEAEAVSASAGEGEEAPASAGEGEEAPASAGEGEEAPTPVGEAEAETAAPSEESPASAE